MAEPNAFTATLYADRTAGQWTSIAPNPLFTQNMDGWRGAYLDWRWSNGHVLLDLAAAPYGYAWLYAAPGIPRPQAPEISYRIRTRAAIPGPLRVTAGIYFHPNADYSLPWTLGPGARCQTLMMPNPETLPAGLYDFEAVWGPEENDRVDPGYRWLCPFLSWDRLDASGPYPLSVDLMEFSYRGGAGLDVSGLVEEVTIRHGRPDPVTQPEASAATIVVDLGPEARATLTGAPAGTMTEGLPVFEAGAGLTIETTIPNPNPDPEDPDPAPVPRRRFIGRITDEDRGWSEAGEQTPDALETTVIAVGTLADLGREPIGDVPWPRELDGARILRIMTAAGITLDQARSDPGSVLILERDVDSQPALDLAHQVARDANAVVWQSCEGERRYADAEHRRGVRPSLELDASALLVAPRWKRTTQGLVNYLSLGYGPTPEGSEQPRIYELNQSSRDRWGRYGESLATQLATLADARRFASLYVGRAAYPVWTMPDLPVDVEALTEEQYLALLGLEMHDLITLTGLPGAGDAPSSAALWIEGWTERIATQVVAGELHRIHEITLSVSGYCRTVPPPRWADIDPTWTWDTVDPALTWDDTHCLGPPADRGRWADVPASLRWSQIPPEVTWDTWQTRDQNGAS